jgi:hypothetical protein
VKKHVLLCRLAVFNFAPQQSGGSVCILPQNPYEQIGVSGVFPLVFIGLLGVTLGLHRLYQFVLAKWTNDPAGLPALDLVPWTRTLVVLALSCYTQVASSVLLYLQVRNLMNVGFSAPSSFSPVHRRRLAARGVLGAGNRLQPGQRQIPRMARRRCPAAHCLCNWLAPGGPCVPLQAPRAY